MEPIQNQFLTEWQLKYIKRISIILFSVLFNLSANAQYINMSNLNEFGIGNYFAHVTREADAKRIITEKIKLNGFSTKKLEFNSGRNLFFSSYFVNPMNTEFVYVMNCIRVREGWDIWFYYIENRYRYFYDVTENNGRIAVIYDPAILANKDIAPTKD